MIAAFTGSRAKWWTFAEVKAGALAVGEAVKALKDNHGARGIVISVGDADGVDAWVRLACRRFGVCYVVHRANWRAPVPGGAGHERNTRVITGAQRLLAITPAARPTPGTSDAMIQAARRGIPVFHWFEGRWH